MKHIYLAAFISLAIFSSCKSNLDEEVYSSFGPNNFFKTAADAEALLNSAYAIEQRQGSDGFRNILLMSEVNTDLLIVREGGLRATAQPLEDFTWNPAHEFFDNAWTKHYAGVYRANLVIDNVPHIQMDEARKTIILAEARFIRASHYINLFYLFGPTPLILSSVTNASDRPERAKKEEYIDFVIKELTAVAEILPLQAINYGRATKGAAIAMLAKYQLNLKNFAAADAAADQVIALGVYKLFEAPDRTHLFAIENEQNSEFIYVRPYISQAGLGTNYLSHVAPPNYKFKGAAKTNYATQLKTLSAFLNSFDPQDQRKQAIITSYENINGQNIQLGKDDARSFKFPEDLAATGVDAGNDFPVIRYADILLTKAESRNELQGPNQESIDLINSIRVKAGVKLLVLSDFPTKESLRNHILVERGWEFFSEELRRQDLIRHGKFISEAITRGKSAADYQQLYPIPQSEIDRNSNLTQNPGY